MRRPASIGGLFLKVFDEGARGVRTTTDVVWSGRYRIGQDAIDTVDWLAGTRVIGELDISNVSISIL